MKSATTLLVWGLKSSFNSLYEIRDQSLSPNLVTGYLSILFMRFGIWRVGILDMKTKTFNSLYEILTVMHMGGGAEIMASFNSLYEIPYSFLAF